MIVAVSTTNFPSALTKAYSQSRISALFFVINTFVMNIVLLNLIMAVFFFYYSNFYAKNVKTLKGKKKLLLKLLEEQKKNDMIDEETLQELVEEYCENPDTDFKSKEGENGDDQYKEIKKKTQNKNKEFDQSEKNTIFFEIFNDLNFFVFSQFFSFVNEKDF